MENSAASRLQLELVAVLTANANRIKSALRAGLGEPIILENGSRLQFEIDDFCFGSPFVLARGKNFLRTGFTPSFQEIGWNVPKILWVVGTKSLLKNCVRGSQTLGRQQVGHLFLAQHTCFFIGILSSNMTGSGTAGCPPTEHSKDSYSASVGCVAASSVKDFANQSKRSRDALPKFVGAL